MKLFFTISILLVFILSGSRDNNTRIFCNNRISNQDLVSIIEDFVKRAQNTKLDSINSYLILTLFQNDSVDLFSLRHAHEGDLLYCHQRPIIVCSPIANKKIIFVTSMLENYVNGDLSGAASFYKDEYPNVYAKNRKYIKAVKEQFEKVGLIDETTAHISYRSLEMRFSKNGKFIDSTYINYNRTPNRE